jgi:hypothetical protein
MSVLACRSEERLFGENQFVFAGHAQQVTLAGVFNFKGAVAAHEFFAVNPWPRREVFSDRGWIGRFWHGFHDFSNANEN